MPTPKTPFRVGLIGYGYAGATFHAPLLTAVDGLELIGVSSRDPDRVHADLPHVTVHADPMALATAEGIDLIVIASPNASHAPLARAAMTAGKAVVVDKPFTLDLAEARELVALSDTTGQLLSVFHNRRWDSDFLSVGRSIRNGDVGRVSHFESHFDRFRPEVRSRWREQAGAGSGIWYDLGPHLIDQALLLFGLPDRVLASLAAQRQSAQTDDWAHVVLIYGAMRVVLHASMLVAGGARRFVVHGDAGSLVKRESDRQEAQLLSGLRPGAPGWGQDPDPLIIYSPEGDDRQVAATAGDQLAFYRGIVAALEGREPNPVSPIEALAVMAVVEAAVESSRTECAVPLDLNDVERERWIRSWSDQKGG